MFERHWCDLAAYDSEHMHAHHFMMHPDAEIYYLSDKKKRNYCKICLIEKKEKKKEKQRKKKNKKNNHKHRDQ